MAQLPYDATNLPNQFVVKRHVGDREGYLFFKSILAQTAQDQQPWRKISPAKHLNRYYNIHTNNPQYTNTPETQWRRCNIVKNGGTVKREIQWRHNNERLHYNGQYWPCLTVFGFENFPTWNAQQHFAPITTPVAPAPPAAPAQQQQNTIKTYPIPTIPQHAIRALLTQALYNDEQCPIMDIPIDVSNGAVTSCFHIFDKTALDRWLKQPGSGQKCPVCNQPCNSYALQNEIVEELPDDGVIEIEGEA